MAVVVKAHAKVGDFHMNRKYSAPSMPASLQDVQLAAGHVDPM
jgi:hypothetical protein